MDGTFESYDEKTGEIVIKVDLPHNFSIENEILREAVFNDLKDTEEILKRIYDRYHYRLIVPEGHRSRTSIPVNGKVTFEVVEAGSKEVKSIKY